jgi:hypothetical protein
LRCPRQKDQSRQAVLLLLHQYAGATQRKSRQEFLGFKPILSSPTFPFVALRRRSLLLLFWFDNGGDTRGGYKRTESGSDAELTMTEKQSASGKQETEEEDEILQAISHS